MKPRKLKLVAMVSGFATNIAEVHIQNFASEPELKDWTELVCPERQESWPLLENNIAYLK
jgi:hypothetical protein